MKTASYVSLAPSSDLNGPGSSPGVELEAIWIPPGLGLRPRALVGAGLAFVLWILWLARPGHSGLAVPVGAAFALSTSLLLLRGLGCFDSARTPHFICAGRDFAKSSGGLLLASAGLISALRLAVAGVLPQPAWSNGVLVTLGSLACLYATAQLLETLGVSPRRSSRLFSGGAGVLSLGVILYVPLLGSFSLIDPWETHYGEVAREMLARDDWLSFWWAHERWFFSKPALDFWLQGLSFSLLGVRYEPDGMLSGSLAGHAPGPEWAARFPVVVLALVASYLVYHAVARHAGRRAAGVAGVVLLTSPYWFFLSRNSMTDMPYAAPVTTALAALALGFAAPSDRPQREFAVQFGAARWTFSARNLVLGLVLCTSLPILAYLASRNLSWSLSGGFFRFRADLVSFGSGGHNCGLPGNDPCALYSQRNAFFQPAFGAGLWLLPLGLFLFANRGEYRVRRLYYLTAWYFTALAALGKGAPGLVLPLFIAVAAILISGRYRRLIELELVGLLLLLGAVTLPWYVQVFMRHGPEFTDRLLFYDMYQRAFEHVHDTNSGEDVSFRYYIRQLGYGLFPWTGLAFSALLGWRALLASRRPLELAQFFGLWAVLTFALFSASLTKFHHYILPAVPPISAVTGLLLARALPPAPRTARWQALLRAWLPAVLAASAAWLGAWCLSLGARRDAELRVARLALGVLGPTLALGALLWAARTARGASTVLAPERSASSERSASPYRSAVLGLCALLGAGFLGLVTWDLSNPGAVVGESRLLHLFSYNYARPFPTSADFSAELASFGWVAATFCALLVLPSLRAVLARALLVIACTFCVFGLDVYLLRIAPHSGQRNTILAYYRARKSSDELLVAYQLNWKGENFYTGNRLATFISTGQKFTSFMAERREAGQQVLFFTGEHGRLSALRTELGPVQKFELLTTRDQNDKFFMARVEL